MYETTEYEEELTLPELMDELERESPYKRRPPEKDTKMTVKTMGDMLGLKKTARYWLVQKNFFEVTIHNDTMLVDIASFEKWYANQVRYHKVNGEEPGRELKEWSYSPKDIAELLSTDLGNVYEFIERDHIETVEVDHWMRIPKAAFDVWYKNQERYRTREDREKDAELIAASMTQPEMARALGIKRSEVYKILRGRKYGWMFEIVMIAGKKRVTRESFERFLLEQDTYRLDPHLGYEEVAMEDNIALAEFRRKNLVLTDNRKANGNLLYLSRSEAAFLANVSESMITSWAQSGFFPVVKRSKVIRIEREPFEAFLRSRKLLKEGM